MFLDFLLSKITRVQKIDFLNTIDLQPLLQQQGSTQIVPDIRVDSNLIGFLIGEILVQYVVPESVPFSIMVEYHDYSETIVCNLD